MNFFWSYRAVGASYEEVIYGYLYNWYAVDTATTGTDIANTGWHVPTFTEQQTLRTYAGGSNSGIALKEIGTTYWSTDNGSTNTYGFNSRGAGTRVASFGSILNIVDYWSATQATATDGNSIRHTYNSLNTTLAISAKYSGYSVRLIKDSTTLTHGQTGTYTGNDGKIYRTICIGTQEWLADNLKETKYRNGSLIPVVTDNTAWTALTTGARCVYDNNESYA